LIIFGVTAGGLLMTQMHRVEHAQRERSMVVATPAMRDGPARWGVLARVMAVVMLRSWVMLAVLQFIPIWYDDLGYDRRFYGPLVTIIILAGAVGTLLGGALADRIGQRVVITGSLMLAVPPLLLFAGFPGPIAYATGIALGLLGDASLSVTLVAAQRLLPGRVGMASGVILGLGFVTGGIGVPVTGKVADAVGIDSALMLLSLLCLAAAALSLTIPQDALTTAAETSLQPAVSGREATADRALAVGGK
jgi:FSR family fosmidomycin resistance protein-like MFS transporter